MNNGQTIKSGAVGDFLHVAHQYGQDVAGGQFASLAAIDEKWAPRSIAFIGLVAEAGLVGAVRFFDDKSAVIIENRPGGRVLACEPDKYDDLAAMVGKGALPRDQAIADFVSGLWGGPAPRLAH